MPCFSSAGHIYPRRPRWLPLVAGLLIAGLIAPAWGEPVITQSRFTRRATGACGLTCGSRAQETLAGGGFFAVVVFRLA